MAILSAPTPLLNAPAAITLLAVVDHYHYISRVYWSYSGVPVAGGITITDGGVTVFNLDITLGGNDSRDVNIKSVSPNTAMVVTLASGGVGIQSKLIIDTADQVY